MSDYIVPFTECGMEDVARVGGKNASLGEMIRELSRLGIRVPDGFATTAAAYRRTPNPLRPNMSRTTG